MENNYYTAEGIDKSIILKFIGPSVENRVWCVGYKRGDKTHRIREADGFYNIDHLLPEKIKNS